MPTASNTSPISNLAAIGRLSLLHDQFSDIWIPQAVAKELQQYEAKPMKTHYNFEGGKRGPVLRCRRGKSRITIRLDDDLLQ